MPVLTLFFLLLCIPSLTFSHNDRTGDDLPPLPLGKRAMMNNVPAIGYYDPNANGGSMLTVSSLSLFFLVSLTLIDLQQVNGTFPPGLGEPINIVLSGNSEAAVLVDSETNGGLRNYFLCVPRWSMSYSAHFSHSGHLDSPVNVWVSILAMTRPPTLGMDMDIVCSSI